MYALDAGAFSDIRQISWWALTPRSFGMCRQSTVKKILSYLISSHLILAYNFISIQGKQLDRVSREPILFLKRKVEIHWRGVEEKEKQRFTAFSLTRFSRSPFWGPTFELLRLRDSKSILLSKKPQSSYENNPHASQDDSCFVIKSVRYSSRITLPTENAAAWKSSLKEFAFLGFWRNCTKNPFC